MGSALKQLEMYFKLFHGLFLLYEILMDSVICIKLIKQSYTVLLKSNEILYLILGTTFGKCFLTVSNKGEDNLTLF